MAKQLQAVVQIPHSLAHIRQQLLSPAELERIALATGALEAIATAADNTTTVRRTFPVPDVARGFLGLDELHVTETRVWGDDSADVTVAIDGVAVSAMGRVSFAEDNEHTTARLEAVIEANMGFTGMFAETMVADRLQRVFEAEGRAIA